MAADRTTPMERRGPRLGRAWALLLTVALLVLAAGITLVRLGLPLDRLPPGASRIALPWAAAAFRQCSRDSPQADGGYWTPSADQIARLELELPPMLERRARAGLATPPPFEPFRRQYIGFVRKSRRLIYGNFSPAGMPSAAWPPFVRPVVVCDGGKHFWGVVYDPETGVFEAPEFNGVA